jgi:hypothetical protein
MKPLNILAYNLFLGEDDEQISYIKENDFELMQGFIASSRHWKVDSNGDPAEVLLLTDSAKLTERRDVVNVQVVIEDQDLKTNE